MGEPLFLAQKEQADVIYISSDIDFYEEMSKRVMQKIENYTKIVEKYSIDEAFVEGCDQQEFTDKVVKLVEDRYNAQQEHVKEMGFDFASVERFVLLRMVKFLLDSLVNKIQCLPIKKTGLICLIK